MQTLTPTPAANLRKAKAVRLSFPDLPSREKVDKVDFWLVAWARDLAAHDALVAHSESSTVWKVRTKNKPLSLALVVARDSAEFEIRKSVEHLKDVGGLLFAVVGTTKLQQQVIA